MFQLLILFNISVKFIIIIYTNLNFSSVVWKWFFYYALLKFVVESLKMNKFTTYTL